MTSPVDLAAFVRRHTAAILQAEDTRRRIRYVVDGAAGLLVTPLQRPELESDEVVLFVPDEGDDAAQLLVTASEIREGRPTDRWLAYHAMPDAPHWAALRVDAARLDAAVVDGEIDLTCPFAPHVSALCKHANAATAALVALCTSHGVTDTAPVLVGVDAGGADVRTRVGIIRIDFTTPVADADAARRALDRLLAREPS